jgi:hypothetical protein
MTKSKIVIVLLLIIVFSTPCFADRYVRDCDGDSSCGTAAGTSWTNPYDTLAAAETAAGRGETIWVADGAYSSVTLNTSTSGTTYIYIKKATASAHGTDTGWDNAYGDGTATITGNIQISTAYWDIDGVTGTGNSGHGIKISYTGVYGGITIPTPVSSKHHIKIRHVEFDGTGFTNGTSAGIYAGFSSETASYSDPNLLVEYCYFHHQGGLHIITVSGNYFVIRNSYFDTCCGHNSTGHKEMIKDNGGGTADYWWIHHNTFKDWRGYSVTGGIIMSEGNDYWYIYDNIFYWTAQTLNGGNRAIGFLSSGTKIYSNIHAYNNTFYNIGHTSAANVMDTSDGITCTTCNAKNNLWISCDGLYAVGGTGVTDSNNAYYDTPNWTSREATDVSLVADPLTNSAAYDFTVASDVIKTGADLSAYFTTDFAGNVWSTWGQGAYMYTGAPAPDVTAPTITSATIDSTGTTLTLVFSEAVSINDSTGFTLSCNGAEGEGLAYAENLVYTITGRAIEGPPSKETCTLDYATVANGIEDAAGNDLATIGDPMAVVNNSTYTPTAATYTVTPSTNDGCAISPQTAVSVYTGTTTQFTCTAGSNHTCVAWTETGAGCGTGSGTTTFTTGTITGDCAISQSCPKTAADSLIGEGAAMKVGSGAAMKIY